MLIFSRKKRVWLVCGMLLLCLALGTAQEQHHVKGELRSDDTSVGTDVIVDAFDQQTHIQVDSALAGINGQFEFRNLKPGPYKLRVRRLSGEPITEQLVDLRSHSGLLEIRLPRTQIQKPVSGAVSVNHLQSRPSKKTLRYMREGQRAADKGNPESAAERYRLALALNPDVAEIHCNLGVQYIHLGRHREALTELREAARLDPSSAPVFANIAFTLLVTGSTGDAEHAARRAVSLDSRYLKGRYILGHVLAQRGTNLKEAIANLKLASAEIPRAHLVLAQVYARTGSYEEAKAELTTYLPGAPDPEKTKIQSWMAQLK